MILGREDEKLIILHNEVVINYNASIVCADAFCGSCVFSSEKCPVNYNIWYKYKQDIGSMMKQRSNEVIIVYCEQVELHRNREQICYSLECSDCKMSRRIGPTGMRIACVASGTVWDMIVLGTNIVDKLEIKQ